MVDVDDLSIRFLVDLQVNPAYLLQQRENEFRLAVK